MHFESSPEKNLFISPERPSSSLDLYLDTFKKIESGEMEILELSPEEREQLLFFEKELGEKLEKIYEIVAPKTTLYPEYFLTDNGKEEFEKNTGVKIEGDTPQEILLFLISNRALFKDIDPAKRKRLSGDSESYSDERLLSRLLETYENTGSLNVRLLEHPKRVGLVVDPDKILKKITLYRDFKRKLKTTTLELSPVSDGNLVRAKREVLTLYKKRVNELIVDYFESLASIKNISILLGENSLSDGERMLSYIYTELASPERAFSRYDKFLYGSGKDYDDQGMRQQISLELLEYAKKIEQEYLENDLAKDFLIKQKGLDRKKLEEKNISKETFIKLAEETLTHYDLQSSLSGDDYSPDRPGSAPDNKWQLIVRPEHKTMSVSGKQKVVKAPEENMSIIMAIGTLIGHEIEGHVLQHENKSNIPLRLFEKIGAGRSEIFAEGGAMFNENEITTGAFGFKNIPHAHYVKAMAKKLEGGTYLDCVETFFKSAQKKTLLKKEQGSLDDALFLKETKSNLKTAINRSKRLFHSSLDWSVSSSYLSRSRDTVYLEQLRLLEKLRSAGLEKFAYIAGANLSTLISLFKMGLLDKKRIKSPDFYALKIWERLKENYELI